MKKEDKICTCQCNNGFGIASVVLGIVGSVLGVLMFPVIISIFGLVFGIIQIKRAKNAWAIWGIILSVLGIIISAFVVWKLMAVSSQFEQTMTLCQTDPTSPGCSDLLGLMGVQS